MLGGAGVKKGSIGGNGELASTTTWRIRRGWEEEEGQGGELLTILCIVPLRGLEGLGGGLVYLDNRRLFRKKCEKMFWLWKSKGVIQLLSVVPACVTSYVSSPFGPFRSHYSVYLSFVCTPPQKITPPQPSLTPTCTIRVSLSLYLGCLSTQPSLLLPSLCAIAISAYFKTSKAPL